MVEAEISPRRQTVSRRPYQRILSKTTWYLRNGRYRSYILRELTCLLVVFYSAGMIIGLAALASGSPARWEAVLAAQQNTPAVVFHSFALIFFVVYQTLAWFRLAPKAMVLRIAGRKVPDRSIVLAHYLVWAALTLGIFWLAGVF